MSVNCDKVTVMVYVDYCMWVWMGRKNKLSLSCPVAAPISRLPATLWFWDCKYGSIWINDLISIPGVCQDGSPVCELSLHSLTFNMQDNLMCNSNEDIAENAVTSCNSLTTEQIIYKLCGIKLVMYIIKGDLIQSQHTCN